MDQLKAQLDLNLDKASKDAKRLFHGRSKQFEGLEWLTIDYYGRFTIISLFSEIPAELESKIVEIVKSKVLPECLFLQRRYLSKSSTELVSGDELDEYIATENEMVFKINPFNQNTGLFLDMKEGRSWVKSNSKGLKVLNLFSYTCSLSIAACLGGSKKVINFDMAKGAINTGRINHKMNNILGDKAEFYAHDIFKSFGKIKKLAPYDLIIIDPPSNQGKSFKIETHYPKLLKKIVELLSESGTLFICNNSPYYTIKEFQELIESSLNEKKLKGTIFSPSEFLEYNKENGLKILVY